MFSPSVIYNRVKLRSSAICTAGEDFISQRIDWKPRFTFTDKEKDRNTGYHYFGARYYDSEVSVWLSVDPMSDIYPSTSPYAYVENNPIMFIDPNGMETIARKQEKEDWFMIEKTGDVYYNSELKKGDEGKGLMQGDNWVHMGKNGMLTKDEVTPAGAELSLVTTYGGKIKVNGNKTVSAELMLKGDNAESFIPPEFKMKANLLYSIFMIFIAYSCNSQSSIKSITKDYLDRKEQFESKLVNHFPDILPNDVLLSGGLAYYNKKECNIPKSLFLVAKYNRDDFNKLLYEDSVLFGLNRLPTDLAIIVFKNCHDTIVQDMLYDNITFNLKKIKSHNLSNYKSYAVPYFDLEKYFGNKVNGISENFNTYVIETKKDLDKYENMNYDSDYYPAHLKHGYSRGITISKSQKVIIFWTIIW